MRQRADNESFANRKGGKPCFKELATKASPIAGAGNHGSKSGQPKRTSDDRSPSGAREATPETDSCKSDDTSKRARTEATFSRSQEEPTTWSSIPKIRDLGQQCLEDPWTCHVTKVACCWELKLMKLEAILEKGQKTNEDLQALEALGLTSWDEAEIRSNSRKGSEDQ